MTKTVPQKILSPIINFLVERYFPNSVFYGNDFFDAFNDIEACGPDLGAASVAWLTHNMHAMNAETYHLEIKRMSIKGEVVGDFDIVATLKKPKGLGQ